MYLFLYYLALVLVTNGVTSEEALCETLPNEPLEVAVAFTKAGLIDDDILPVTPTGLLRVIFDSVEAFLGNVILSIQTVLAPSFAYEDADPTANYTLILIDADPISCVTSLQRFYLISLCVNIKGTEIDEKNGDQIAPYINYYPTEKSGKKRKIALLYEQPCYINPTNPPLVEASIYRVGFNLTQFVSNFTLGNPVAGNFWRSAACKNYDKYCKAETAGCCEKNTESCKEKSA